MKNLVLVIVVSALSFLVGAKYYNYSPLHASAKKAVAVMIPTKGNTATGKIIFEEKSDGLHISAIMTGLTPGEHGLHVHEFGNCACDDAKCAGDHYNPTGKSHGARENTDRHVGDFGNITADDQGNVIYEFIDKIATLNGRHSIIGRAMIVHEKADDLHSQPSGEAGARISCGVIGIAKAD